MLPGWVFNLATLAHGVEAFLAVSRRDAAPTAPELYGLAETMTKAQSDTRLQ